MKPVSASFQLQPTGHRTELLGAAWILKTVPVIVLTRYDYFTLRNQLMIGVGGIVVVAALLTAWVVFLWPTYWD
jgi:hypothetical protein